MEEQLERLLTAGFLPLPISQFTAHAAFERDGFVALVELRPDGFGAEGAMGLLVENRVAMLMTRPDGAFFVAKGGWERAASAEEVETLRRCAQDLREALRGPAPQAG